MPLHLQLLPSSRPSRIPRLKTPPRKSKLSSPTIVKGDKDRHAELCISPIKDIQAHILGRWPGIKKGDQNLNCPTAPKLAYHLSNNDDGKFRLSKAMKRDMEIYIHKDDTDSSHWKSTWPKRIHYSKFDTCNPFTATNQTRQRKQVKENDWVDWVRQVNSIKNVNSQSNQVKEPKFVSRWDPEYRDRYAKTCSTAEEEYDLVTERIDPADIVPHVDPLILLCQLAKGKEVAEQATTVPTVSEDCVIPAFISPTILAKKGTPAVESYDDEFADEAEKIELLSKQGPPATPIRKVTFMLPDSTTPVTVIKRSPMAIKSYDGVFKNTKKEAATPVPKMKRLDPIRPVSISPTLLRKKAVRFVESRDLGFEDEKFDEILPRNISPINLNKKIPGPVECYDDDFEFEEAEIAPKVTEHIAPVTTSQNLDPVLPPPISPTLVPKKVTLPVECYDEDFEDEEKEIAKHVAPVPGVEEADDILPAHISPINLNQKVAGPIECYDDDFEFEDEKAEVPGEAALSPIAEEADDVLPSQISPININTKVVAPVECYDDDFGLGDEDALDLMNAPSLITPTRIIRRDSGLQAQNQSENITQTCDIPITPVTVIHEPSTSEAIKMDDTACTDEDVEAAPSAAKDAKALEENIEVYYDAVMDANAEDGGRITEAVPYEDLIDDFLHTIKNPDAAALAHEATSEPKPLPEAEPENVSEPMQTAEPVPKTPKEVLSIHIFTNLCDEPTGMYAEDPASRTLKWVLRSEQASSNELLPESPVVSLGETTLQGQLSEENLGAHYSRLLDALDLKLDARNESVQNIAKKKELNESDGEPASRVEIPRQQLRSIIRHKAREVVMSCARTTRRLARIVWLFVPSAL
ncbi:hypothetical protein IQ07DRAFT_596103 [Pyrenochaeta sp. DS3sAY3a]|nr:hypothetical protein IQ07DRAFT_596103 [Pyrenochaeta sp. DS3sAY3a]